MVNLCMIPIVKSPQDYQVYRISPSDRHRVAIVFDSTNADNSLTVCVEIFECGSQIPPHRHNAAVEMFFVLKGEGLAVCDGKEVKIRAGDSILMPKSGTHQIINTGSQRLYVLCFMVPNEDFTELIRSGIPESLDAEDFRVLNRLDSPVAAG